MLNNPNWFNESDYSDFLAESSILWEINIPYQKQKFENRKKMSNFDRETAIRKGRLKSELTRELYQAKAKGIRMGLGEEFKKTLMDDFFEKLMEAKTAIKAEKSRMRPEVNPEDKERDRKREDRRQEKQKNPLSRVIIVKNTKNDKVEIITKDDFNPKTHKLIKGKIKDTDKGPVTKADLVHYSKQDNFMNTKTSIKLLGKKQKEKEPTKTSSAPKQTTSEKQTPPPPTIRVPKDGKEITDPDSTYPDWDHSVNQFTYSVPDALNTLSGIAPSQQYQQMIGTSRTLGDSLNRFVKELTAAYPQISTMKFEKLEPVVKTGKMWAKMGVKEAAPNANTIGVSKDQTLGFAIKIGDQISPTIKGEAAQVLNTVLSTTADAEFNKLFSLFLSDFVQDLRKKFFSTNMYPPSSKIEQEGSMTLARQQWQQENVKNNQTLFVNSCGNMVEKFLNKNIKLKSAFLYESLSGNGKFDGKTGSAQVLLSSKKDGSDLAAIPLDMNFATILAKSDRSDMNLNFVQTPNSSGGFFQSLMQRMGTINESSMDVLLEIERIKSSISDLPSFMNAFELQLYSVAFINPVVYSDFYTPDSDRNTTVTINQGTNREEQIVIPVRANYTPEGDEQNIIEKGIDQILQEYLLINDYLVENINSNNMSLEEANEFFENEFGMLTERNYRKEYDNYHSKPDQRKNRSKRVLARRKLEKEGRVHKGDGKDVDHKNGNPQDNSDDNLRVLSKSKNRSMNEDHGAGFEGTPEVVKKLMQDTPGSESTFVGIKSIPYLESQLDKKLKAKKK